MGRIILALILLTIAALFALIIYAYVGDLAPEPAETRVPVTLDVSP
ncbi:MAG: hypothetical protein ACKVPY_14565 [Paracoccaceae bacterium]